MSLSVVERSQPEVLRTSSAALAGKVTQLGLLIALQDGAMTALRTGWLGAAADSAAARAAETLARQRELQRKLVALQAILAAGGADLTSTRSAVMSIVAQLRAAGWRISDDGAATAPPFPEILKALEPAFTAVIRRLLELFDGIDAATAAAVGAAPSGSHTMSLGFGAAVPLSPPDVPDTRRQHQIEAFRQATGREPETPNDWRTAAMLDAHTYLDKNDGVASNVVVGHINPVQGQGVVQTNLFIPGEEAWYLDLDLNPTHLDLDVSGHNLGDNRGFNPQAGPEDSRVVLYVDYDNGLVIGRQNPSVDTGGEGVQTGTPRVNVSQKPSGSVKIDYQAADPFSPGGENLAMNLPWNVNGQLVVKPTPDGPVAGGIVSSFPAIEIYHHSNDGTQEIAKIMPQNTSQLGPLLGLPLSQNIFPGGDGSPPVPSASPPVPYPSVRLGPVGDGIDVPVGR